MRHRPYSVHKAERLLRRKRRRVLLGIVGLIVVAGVAVGASYLWLYAEWQKTQIKDPALLALLDSAPAENLFPNPAGTMTILIMGTDARGWEAIRSDSMMLVHVDPAKNYLSTLSLPRDSWVEISGHGKDKLNAAYTWGGAKLTIPTIEKLTGVDITHYMEIDFNAFKSLTDAVGGVYLDVDKHYLQQDPQYDMIDLMPGYQRLDGKVGLDYVRFRKDDNLDFGRQLRQQRFLAALREQALGWELGARLPGLVKSLTDNIHTNISFDEIRNLVYWVVSKLGGGQTRQLTVIGSNVKVDGTWRVVLDAAALDKKVDEFMTAPAGGGAPATTGAASTGASAVTTAGSSSGVPTASASVDSSQFITDEDSIADASMWKQIAAATPFKVMAPGYLPPGYTYHERNPETGPGYDLGTGNGADRGLKLVYQLVREGKASDHYMGIMETTWLAAPAASPGRQVTYNGIDYTVVGTYDMTERVWWKKDGMLYWVSNTLFHSLEAEDLIKVAASMIPISSQ
jgi:LCP family protein required for cell wall assembly